MPNKKFECKYEENITLCSTYLHIHLMKILTVGSLNLKIIERLEVCCFENNFDTIFIYIRRTDLSSRVLQNETIGPTDEH
jgi:hypothetical protein